MNSDVLLDAGRLLLGASLKASALIFVVAMIQWIGREKIPAGWRYAMWIVVIVRLLLPVAPESRFSIFNLISPAREPLTLSLERTPGIAAAPMPSLQRTPAVPAPQSPAALALLALWAAGVVALAGRAFAGSFRLSRRVHLDARVPERTPAHARLESIVAECTRDLGMHRAPAVVETTAVSSPALHGIFRPKLLVPHDLHNLFSDDELRYIVLHELAHLRRADVAVNVLASAVECLHWFNPLVWIALARMREDRELACDRAALARLRAAERSEYGHTILKLVDCFRTPRIAPALVGMASRHDEMKRRILMIAAFKKSSRASLAFAGVVALLGFASLTDAQTAKWVMKSELAPEAKVTFDRLSAPIDVEFTEARVLDIVQSIAAKAGVSVTVAPEVSSALTDAPAVSLKTEKLPANVALIHTLGSVGLGLKFAATGIEITKADQAMDHVRVIHAGEHKMDETERVLVFRGKGEIPEDIEGDLEALPGDGKERVIVKHIAPAGGDGEHVEKRMIMIHPDGTNTEAGEMEMLHIDGAKLEIKVHKKN